MKFSNRYLQIITIASLLLTGCSKEDNLSIHDDNNIENNDNTVKDYFDITFFGNNYDLTSRKPVTGPQDRIQSLMYIIYQYNENSQKYEFFKENIIFDNEDYSQPKSHIWPLEPITERLKKGKYKVVFFGNYDVNQFEGQGNTNILTDIRGNYNQLRINLPINGSQAFNDYNMFYMDTAEFDENTENLNILMERIVTSHDFIRQFIDENESLDLLVHGIATQIKNNQITTDLVRGFLHSALLDGLTKALGLETPTIVVTTLVDELVGALLGDLINSLYKNLLDGDGLLSHVRETLKADNTNGGIAGLNVLLNPWFNAQQASITGKFIQSMDADLSPITLAGSTSFTWNSIKFQDKNNDKNKYKLLNITTLNGNNRIEKINIDKEGLVLGPLLSWADDDLLYGRLVTIENDLMYNSKPNIKYSTTYALLNLTINNYGESYKDEPLHITAKLKSALVTEELLKDILGNFLGSILGGSLSKILGVVTEALDDITIALDIKLPNFNLQNVVIEGGWEDTELSTGGTTENVAEEDQI